MNINTIIGYLGFMIASFYVLGFMLVWLFELKLTSLFQNFQKKIHSLENMSLSMAVKSAKTFKFDNDYRASQERIIHYQQIILKSMLVNRKFIENKKGLSLSRN
jgi:hypothetical protein